MSDELREAVETESWEFVDYVENDISEFQDVYADYLSSTDYN